MRVSSEGGIATVDVPRGSGAIQFSVNPSSSSGDGSVTAKCFGGDDFEVVYDSDGNAISIDLSDGTVTHTLTGVFRAIRVTSSNSADSFSLSVTGSPT